MVKGNKKQEKKMEKSRKSYLKYVLGILTFFILFLFIQAPAVHAEANLKQDDKGRYCIETADDFIEFVSSKDYQDTNIVLKNDITISNMPEISGGLFKGIFDGSGKTIYFKENNYRSKESVFPLTLNGTIKNVKIDVQTKLIASTVGNSVNILVNSVSGGTLQGISVVGNVTCVFDKFDLDLGEDLKVSACDSFGGDIFTGQGCEVNDCEFSLNYILGSESDPNLVNDIINNCLFIELYQIGGRQSGKINLTNCFSKACLDQSFTDLYNNIKDQSLDEFLQSGLYVQFLSGSKSSFTNYYYDKDKNPCIEAINSAAKDLIKAQTEKPADYDLAGKTTDEMKQQETYAGFDFAKKWSISSDKNDGYPYYDPKTETITLEVQAAIEPKVWHTDIARDFNRFKDASKNYHFPYRAEKIDGTTTYVYDDGDNNVVTVTGAKFANLTAEQQELVDKYEITAVLPSDDTAAALLNVEDRSLANADNTMGWQPLVFWYNKPGFEDVNKAVDAAEKRLPAIAQRATGSFCTAGYETGCASYGNNAWNDAQAMLFAGTFGVNVLDPASGYTKNGNNILDAFFDLVDVDGVLDGSIHGFTNYDVPQIARGLDAFIRQYEGTSSFWQFTDVPVPTKDVNDLILALDDNSTKAQITAARIAYDALDDAHKAIFNKDTLRKLLDAEGKGNLIEKAVKAIDAIPAADKLTLEDKKTVEKARTLYDVLDAESQAAVSNYSKLTEAEAKIAELEEKQAQETADRKAAESVSTAIASLPTAENLIPNDYVLKRLDEVQAAYDALTETQKALVENYETLQTLRTVAADKKAAAEVTEKINAIGTLNAGNHEQKQALVTEARTAYDALTDIQKGYVANYGVLEKAELFLSTCEKDKQAAYVMSVIDELNTVSKNMADGPLKLTEKNNGVPTEEIWKDWEDYVVNARARYAALDAAQQEQVENLSDLEAAEGYVYQVKAEALKEQLEVLPDAATVKGYEAQPTEAPVETPEEITAETSAAEFDSDVFSDESADIFSTDTTEETQEADFAEMQDTAENDTPSADLRALTDEELTMITAAKNAYEQLTAAEEEKFRTENTALVENMEQLIALALTYPNGQESYQQQFAAEAAQLYATVNPVSRDTYAAVKVFLDRYEKEYQSYKISECKIKPQKYRKIPKINIHKNAYSGAAEQTGSHVDFPVCFLVCTAIKNLK